MKLQHLRFRGYLLPVASFAEAWIEMFLRKEIFLMLASPPSRRRGLKSFIGLILLMLCLSPPSRRRGLKYISWYKKAMESRRLLRGGVD